MTTQMQTLKGFRDFIGKDAKKRQWLISKIQSVFERFGYEPLETPALEYESLLLGKYGAEADKLIFGFEDRGGRRIALRYDQTIPVARVASQYQNDLVFPYKRYQMQPVWRSEKPQKGRYREFLQCDADIIGTQSTTADAELLALCYAIYKEIGFENITLKFNDRKVLFDTIRSVGVKEDMILSVIQTVDKLDKKSVEEVKKELVEKGIDSSAAEKLLKTMNDAQEPDELKQLRQQAETLGVPSKVLQFAPTLARGLDYYTGMIFEGVIEEYKAGSVVGGGRYDNLLKDLVGTDLPATGFAIGFDRTLEAAEELGKLPQLGTSAQVLVTIFSADMADTSMKVTSQLREKGIASEIYLDPAKKLENQLKYASKKQIPYVIILGPEESEKNVVKLKNMQTGEQEELSIEKVISQLLSFRA